jgi:uncharacterized integral membrane protein
MLNVIVAVVFALFFGYLATQNPTPVVLRAAGYSLPAIPLYVVAVGSLLLGLLLGWVFNMITWATSAWTMRGKDKQIHKSETSLNKLNDKLRELEIENARLKESRKDTRDVTPAVS